MFKLSHCRKNQISKYLKYIVSIGFPASIIALWLLICQVVFFFIQSNQGVELTHAINALVRSDLVSSNFDYLARTIGDLERLGAIHCPLLEQIHPHYKAILDLRYRGGCTEHSALLSGEKFEIVSEATNGDQYRIKYSTHNQVSFAIGLWAMRLGGLLLLVTIYLVQGIRQAQLLNITNLRLENAQKISHLSAQIAHDIRSPLSALNIIIGSATNLPENQRTIIRSAVQRISDIANDLLLRGKTSVSSESPVLTKDLGQIFPSDHQALNMLAKDQNHSEAISILTVLQAVSNEKRIQYQNRDGIEIRDDFECAYGLFACISPSGLARVISNLVNNSAEAINNSGQINLAIRSSNQEILISVSDNGRGIASELLSQLGKRGMSIGKEMALKSNTSGSGLGLYHARQTVESANGKLNIQSRLGVGTMVTISLPLATPPLWFLPSIELSEGAILISVDDDPSIHQILDYRLSLLSRSTSLGSEGNASTETNSSHFPIHHLSLISIDQLREWVRENGVKLKSSVFLIDFEFANDELNGLDAIEELGIADHSCLVTSRDHESSVQNRALSLGVKILPKSQASMLVIHLNRTPIEKT